MVAFAIPDVPRRRIPPDGRWHTTAFWRDSISTLVDPTTAAAVTAGLLTVFGSDWAAATLDEPHAPHPFEYWYGLGTGIGRLVRLGRCLQLLGDLPAHVRDHLRNPMGFDAAEAEIRAAALFTQLGASITWTTDSTTRQTDFVADWGEQRVPVEVEQFVDREGGDREFGTIDAQFQRGLSEGLTASLREDGPQRASRATLAPPIDELAPLVEADDGPAMVMARRLGEAYGTRWGHIVTSAVGPGRYESDPGIVVEILREGHGHHWEAALAPGAQVDFARLCQRHLSDVDQQVAALGIPAVVILERRWPPTWWTPVIELVARSLSRGRHPSLGAVIMREADRNSAASRTAEVLHVLPTPRWLELPVAFRERLPCGSHHVDLVPERGGELDRSRLDEQDSARASTPAARLAEALQLMQFGHRMRWSRLQRAHPAASAGDLHEMMLAWSRGDA
jgi:hypothetical protein